jgi:glycerol transport system ATP-binding protein
LELVLDRVALTQRGEQWLDDIDLVLGEGMSVLIGPTLAGKTTLMRVIAGLMPPTSGRVLVNGQDVTTKPVKERSIAFVYQQFVNYPSLTVYENIASPLRVEGRLGKPDIDRRVREVADMLELSPLLERRPAELSGGQQQRTAIARALARKADVVLLDEPLANLDYKLREQLRLELARIFSDAGIIVLYSTADPAEALGFATTTVVMGAGRVAQVGQAVDIYRRPADIAVATAMSDPPINLLPGVVADGELRMAGITIPAPPGLGDAGGPRAVRIGIRPHQLFLSPRSPADVVLAATVRVAEVTGSQTFLHVTADGDEHLVVELEGAREHQPGEALRLHVHPSAFHAFDEATGELILAAPVEVGSHG